MKRLICMSLVLVMALSLCACGAEETPATNPVEEVVDQVVDEVPVETPASGEKVEYHVQVVDTDGNPLAGVMVQICKDACLPGMTDATGTAVFFVDLPADGYKASVLSLPAGYTYATEQTEFYFENDSNIVTITLKAE